MHEECACGILPATNVEPAKLIGSEQGIFEHVMRGFYGDYIPFFPTKNQEVNPAKGTR